MIRQNMMRGFKILLVGLLAIILLGCSDSGAPTTLILTRHAEKMQDGSEDPLLTRSGQMRALRLVSLLEAQQIDAIYSTKYQRNLQTVEPLAKMRSMEITNYAAHDQDVLLEIMTQYAGGTVVVCGHSNTVPQLVNKLIGREKYSDLHESDYSKLFIVTISELGTGKVTLLSY